MPGYGQFCPVAKAMEVLDERWTLLVIRELLAGSTRFNELRRGVPRMSPALLSKRLKSLERAGIIRRSEDDGRTAYRLTDSGRELHDVVTALGVWGLRWIGHLGEHDLDPHLLMWDIRRNIPVREWPRGRTVLAFQFDDPRVRARRWWMVVAGSEVDVCDFDPGHEVAATVETSLLTMTRLWRGDLSWADAARSGEVRISGSMHDCVPRWVGQMALAPLTGRG